MSASFLSFPQLLWAAKVLCEVRLCYFEILHGLYSNQNHFSLKDLGRRKTYYLKTETEQKLKYFNTFGLIAFWNLLVCDWKGIYGASPQVFCWFRELLLANMGSLEYESLCRLCKSLMPWRRELLRKFFCDVSDLTESIDFTQTQVCLHCLCSSADICFQYLVSPFFLWRYIDFWVI